MEPEARMTIAAILTLFFGGIAAGSLNTARQAFYWRDASFVHGVLIKQGTSYHYEYRPKGEPAVVGASFVGERSNAPDGIINDSVRLEYDPNVPEKLRQRFSRGKPSTNFRHFLLTASAGTLFGAVALLSTLSFFHALYDKRKARAPWHETPDTHG